MNVAKPTPEEYATLICDCRADAVNVPFAEVSIGDWKPEIAKCHANVNRWVAYNLGCQAVRGWISCISFGPAGEQLTAHSVVRKPDGDLIDITPVEPGQARGGVFVEHQGDPAEFFDMIQSAGHEMRCPSLDPEADAAALQAMIEVHGGFAASDDPEGCL